MRNDGKAAERLVTDALKDLESKTKFTWLRLYDSHSAGVGSGGNFIPPQPADFLIASPKMVALLEVKSSNRVASLKDCQLKEVFSEVQILGPFLWNRAGHHSLCVFYSTRNKTFEVWDMRHVRKAYLSPPRQRKLQEMPLTIGGIDDLYGMLYSIVC